MNEPVSMTFTRQEWQRIAMALASANIDYVRTSRSSRYSPDPEWIRRANEAKSHCNRICDEAKLDDIFRVEE